MKYRWFLLPIALGLSGCIEAGARAVTHLSYLDTVAWQYTEEVHNDRRWLRGRCRESLTRQIDVLREADDEAGIQALIAANYPGLVTFDVLEALKENPTKVLSKPPMCKVKED